METVGRWVSVLTPPPPQLNWLARSYKNWGETFEWNNSCRLAFIMPTTFVRIIKKIYNQIRKRVVLTIQCQIDSKFLKSYLNFAFIYKCLKLFTSLTSAYNWPWIYPFEFLKGLNLVIFFSLTIFNCICVFLFKTKSKKICFARTYSRIGQYQSYVVINYVSTIASLTFVNINKVLITL